MRRNKCHFSFYLPVEGNTVMAPCTSCGHEISVVERLCPRCGAVHQVIRMKKQTMALTLASTLGVFGVHRFYLDQRTAGLLYLLFCWTGIPALLALIESIVYASTSAQKWADRYNQGRMDSPVPKLLVAVTVGLPLLLFAAFVVSVLFPELDF
jgi:TM2 domain-containing membrane protein YozV